MGFLDGVVKTVSKVANTAVKTTTKVVNTTVKAAPAVIGTTSKVVTKAVNVAPDVVKTAAKAPKFVNDQIMATALAPLGIVKKGLNEVGLGGSFFGPLGTFIKYLPYLAVLSLLAWFVVEYRKGNSRIVLG